MNEPQILADTLETLDLGRLLSQRRAFGAVAGRCSAAHAQLLRRIRDEKLYRPLTPSWRAFCSVYLALSRRHADRLIGLLNRFGPVYFEFSQLAGISPQQYLAIQPAVREDCLLVNGEAVSVIPENAPKIPEVGDQPVRKSRQQPHAPQPETLRTRVEGPARRGRTIVNQLVALYNDCRSERDREFVLEVATELRMILMRS